MAPAGIGATGRLSGRARAVFRPSVGRMRDRRLERARSGKRIAGVCAGLAKYTGISVTLLRVGFVIFAVTGIGELVYLLLWVFTPKATGG